MQKPKVIVSHPGRQHSHQTAYAFQEQGMLQRYFTSIWYKPEKFPYRIIKYLPSKLQALLVKELKKRYSELIDNKLIEQIPVYELLGRIAKVFSISQQGRFIYEINKKFDKNVSKRIKDINFDVFIGYETSSLESFKRSKELGKICVLDLAAVHYTSQRKIWDMVGIDPYHGKAHLRHMVEMIKHEELTIADYIFTPSEYAKKSILDAGIPEEKIFKIPFGYNAEFFKPKQSYRKNGHFKIIYVSSITKKKGIEYLLQAFKELRLKNAELVMIGGSIVDDRDVLRQYSGLFKHISFLHQEELARYYQDADIFVLPSLVDSFAMVVIEAMACGTPVIISENTGAKEIVRDGIDGFVVPVRDIDKLKEKILYFYENRDKVEEMGKNARAQVKQYTWERYRERIREAVMTVVYKTNNKEQ